MAQRHFNMSRGTMFIAFLIFGILLQLIPQKHTKRMNGAFLRFFNPVLNIPGGRIPRILPRRAPSTEDFVSKNEHNELWIQNENLRGKLEKLQERYDTLAKIPIGIRESGDAMVLAQVINTSLNGYGHEMIINRGSADGLKVNQYVLGPNVSEPDKSSIVGSISEVSRATATVRLLKDLKSSIIVDIRRDGKKESISGQIDGNGTNACKIPLISHLFDIQKGDTVYASAQQGLLETPIVIGQVSDIVRDQSNPLLWDITVRPVYDVKDLNDVAVIVMIPKNEPVKKD